MNKCVYFFLITLSAAVFSASADSITIIPDVDERVVVTIGFRRPLDQQKILEVGKELAANVWKFACGTGRCSAQSAYYKLEIGISYIPPENSVIKPNPIYTCSGHLYGKGFLGNVSSDGGEYLQSIFFRCRVYTELSGLLSSDAFFVDDVDDPDINAIRKR